VKTTVDDILEFARFQGLHSTYDTPERPSVAEEGINTDIFAPNVRGEVDRASPSCPVQWSDVDETIATGESVPSEQLGAHLVDAELVVEGEVGEVRGKSPGGEKQPMSSIAKRVPARPRPRNPSSMQSSPYLHPN